MLSDSSSESHEPQQSAVKSGEPVAAQLQSKALPVGVGMHPVFVVIVVAVIFIVTQLLAALVLTTVLGGFGWSAERSQHWLFDVVTGQFMYMLLAESLIVAAVFWFLRFRKVRPQTIGWNRPRWRHFGVALLGFMAYLLLYFVLLAITKMAVPSLDLDQKQQLGFDTVSSQLDLILTGISLVLLPPLAEEVLFRGFLYTGLRKGMSFLPAAMLTSVVFGVGHLQFGSGAPLLWVAALDTCTLSMVLCFLRERTGSLWPGIGIHMIKNGLAFSVLFIFT